MKRHWHPDELAAHWTILPDEQPLLENKLGATKLAFTVLLKYFQLAGSFPRRGEDVPSVAVAHLAEQLGVPSEAYDEVDWQGRTMKAHRVQIRTHLGSVHDEKGQLVGYAGRSLDDAEPRYLFPAGAKGFRKSRLLFNLHRLLAKEQPASWTVVTEGFFDAMHVVQAGYPCVGLLGSTLSAEQEELLCQNFGQVVLLFDGDVAGRKATDDCLLRLGRRVYVRAIELADGKQPDSMSFEELTQLLEL